MISFTLESVPPFASAVMLAFGAVLATHGQELEFPRYNCAITPPEGWSRVPNPTEQPSLLVTLAKADQTALLLLVINDRQPSGPLNDRFVSDFEQGLKISGWGERTSGKFIEVRGMKAYERFGNFSANGRTASAILQGIPTDGVFYCLQGFRFDGEVSEDPDVRKVLASFRFIKPPQVPRDGLFSQSLGYRTGTLIGRAIVVGIFILAVLTLIRYGLL